MRLPIFIHPSLFYSIIIIIIIIKLNVVSVTTHKNKIHKIIGKFISSSLFLICKITSTNDLNISIGYNVFSIDNYFKSFNIYCDFDDLG